MLRTLKGKGNYYPQVGALLFSDADPKELLSSLDAGERTEAMEQARWLWFGFFSADMLVVGAIGFWHILMGGTQVSYFLTGPDGSGIDGGGRLAFALLSFAAVGFAALSMNSLLGRFIKAFKALKELKSEPLREERLC